MQINFLQLLRKVMSISLVVSAITLSTSLLAGKIMPIDVFGRFSFYQSIFFIIQNLIPVGMGMAIVVYWHKLSEIEFNKLLNFSLFIVVPVSSMFLFILLIFGKLFGLIDDFSNLVALLFYSTAQSMLVLSLSFLRTSYALKQVALVSFANAISIFLTTFMYFYLYEGLSFSKFFFIQAVVSAIIFVFSVKKIFMKLDIRQVVTLDVSIRYYRFGIPVAIHAFLSSFLVGGDKVIIGILADNSDVGLYAFSSLSASFFLFIVNNYASSWGVHLSKLIPQFDSEQLKIYYNKYKFYPLLFLFLIPPFTIVFILIENFYKVEDLLSYYFNSFALIFAYCFYAMTKYYMGYLNCLGFTSLVMRSTIFSCLILIVLSIFLFPTIGTLGVSISVFVAFLINLFINIVVSSKLIGKI